MEGQQLPPADIITEKLIKMKKYLEELEAISPPSLTHICRTSQPGTRWKG